MRSLLRFAVLALLSSVPASVAFADDLPLAYVERPLTLPKLVLAPELSLPITHAEVAVPLLGSIDATLVGLNLGAAFGVTDDFMIDLTPLTLLIGNTNVPFLGEQTKVYYGTFKLGATYRFVGKNAGLAKSDVADLGARVELGASGYNDTIHISWGLPVILHFAKLVRIDTGLFFTGLFPTKKGNSDIAMASIGSAAPVAVGVAAPGIPASVSLGNDFIFGGVDTGFGIASFRGAVDRNCFMPLGFHLGGTIPKDQKPIVDLTASFLFPYFLLGSDTDLPLTQIWSVGLDAKAYFQL